jgi:hypothetical protein
LSDRPITLSDRLPPFGARPAAPRAAAVVTPVTCVLAVLEVTDAGPRDWRAGRALTLCHHDPHKYRDRQVFSFDVNNSCYAHENLRDKNYHNYP